MQDFSMCKVKTTPLPKIHWNILNNHPNTYFKEFKRCNIMCNNQIHLQKSEWYLILDLMRKREGESEKNKGRQKHREQRERKRKGGDRE